MPVAIDPVLRPGWDLDELGAALLAFSSDATVMVVSHQPSLGHALYALTGRTYRVEPGAVAVVELESAEARKGEAIEFFSPDRLIKLGRNRLGR